MQRVLKLSYAPERIAWDRGRVALDRVQNRAAIMECVTECGSEQPGTDVVRRPFPYPRERGGRQNALVEIRSRALGIEKVDRSSAIAYKVAAQREVRRTLSPHERNRFSTVSRVPGGPSAAVARASPKSKRSNTVQTPLALILMSFFMAD